MSGMIKLQEKTVTPSASSQTVIPDKGYGGLSQVIVNGDSDLKAANIKSGVNIFGVTGNLTSYTVKTGTFTPTTANITYEPISITGLGGTPKQVFVFLTPGVKKSPIGSPMMAMAFGNMCNFLVYAHSSGSSNYRISEEVGNLLNISMVSGGFKISVGENTNSINYQVIHSVSYSYVALI